MEAADRVAQLGLFQACRFSESQQALVLQWLEEIAFREKKAAGRRSWPPPAWAAARRRDAAEEDPGRRCTAALPGADARREQEWQAWRRQKRGAGSGVSLAHAPFFAGEEVRVTWTVKDRAQAEKLLAN